MVVVLGIALRMPVAEILNLVRRRIATRVVERAVERDTGGSEADHTHGKTSRVLRRHRLRWHVEREMLCRYPIRVRVVVVRGIRSRDGGRDRRRAGGAVRERRSERALPAPSPAGQSRCRPGAAAQSGRLVPLSFQVQVAHYVRRQAGRSKSGVSGGAPTRLSTRY